MWIVNLYIVIAVVAGVFSGYRYRSVLHGLKTTMRWFIWPILIVLALLGLGIASA